MARSPKSRRSSQRREAAPAHASKPATSHNPSPYKIFRVSRLAELFGVDRITIWRWSKTGVIPPLVRLGGISGLTEDQVAHVLEQQRGDEQ
jgi:predicted DNA-binding transcriptional regulator AlpA